MVETKIFRDRVAKATAGDRWVADGNYLSWLENRLWERADTVVWPDMPLWLIVPRLIRRTVSRAIKRTDLWGSSNRESLLNLVNKKESLVVWAFRTQREHQRTYGKRMTDPAWSHVTIVRLRSRRQVREWLARLRADG